MTVDLVLFPIRRQGPFYDSSKTDIHTYWDLRVSMVRRIYALLSLSREV